MGLSTLKHALETSNMPSKVQVRWETVKYWEALKYTGALTYAAKNSSTLPKPQVHCQELKYGGAGVYSRAHVFESGRGVLQNDSVLEDGSRI